jgi:hypothetical protein
VLATLLWVGVALPASGEGVIEINEARAAAGAITPGDTPGFPVTLSEAGSYRLTQNLAISGTTTTAIAIEADAVTLDLNGFALVGPASGSGHGIQMTARTAVEIRGGTLRGFGGDGIREDGASGVGHRVIGVRVRAMGGDGIRLDGSGHLVADCVALGNGQTGIELAEASAVRTSVASENGVSGITIGAGGTVVASVAHDNGNVGIATRAGGTVSGNATFANASTGLSVHSTTATDNAASYNGWVGIFALDGSSVSGNAAGYNDRDGILAAWGNTLRGANAVHENGDYGLRLTTEPALAGYGRNAATANTPGDVSGGVEIAGNLCGSDTTCP